MTVHKSNGAAQGVASKSNTEKVEPTPGSTQTPQAPEMKPQAKTEQVKAPTVEERKNRHELFNKLLAKHEVYSESQKRMEQFTIGSDENSQTILLKKKNCIFKYLTTINLPELIIIQKNC
ncbi:MAG: hypothetical protein NTU43_01095 [Bacteroidetes bacterium]|nr:hypothetical protein [Bacteroidota bacterium]